MIKKIPITLKRLLNRNYRALYRRGQINGNLALTETGERNFLNFMLSQSDNAMKFADYVREEYAKTDEEESEDTEE